MTITAEIFATLPEETKSQILNTLKAYDSVHVTYANGRYTAVAAVALLAKYTDDYKVIGDAYAVDFYTDEERILNYISCFSDFPYEYRCGRDYMALKAWDEARRASASPEDYTVQMEDGKVVFCYPAAS